MWSFTTLSPYMFSSIWKIHWATNGSTSRLERLHHHTLFNMFFNETFEAFCAWILSCFNPGVSTWVTTQLVFLAFWLSSPIFCTIFHTWLGPPHSLITSILRCVCTHPIDPMGIHFLCCVHGNECTRTHDAIHDTFVSHNVKCWFPCWIKTITCTSFNSSCRRINIVFTKDDIRTLANVVIINPTWVNLFPWSYATQGFVALDVVQVKERNYRNWHPINQFLPWAIEIFGCLHEHADLFLHDCANVIWNFKGIEGLHLFTFVPFLCQNFLITLQRIQVSSILS